MLKRKKEAWKNPNGNQNKFVGFLLVEKEDLKL
jgi:hypothetical protein